MAKVYTLADIYSMLTSEDVEFEQLLAQHALKVAAETIGDIFGDSETPNIPTIEDVRNNAHDFVSDMMGGAVKNIMELIKTTPATTKVKIDLTVKFD